jgi:hypothetical protein
VFEGLTNGDAGQIALGEVALFIDDQDYVNLLEQAAQIEADLSAKVEDAGEMNLAEMFEIQQASNKFSQFSEMMSSLFEARQAAIMSIARGIK